MHAAGGIARLRGKQSVGPPAAALHEQRHAFHVRHCERHVVLSVNAQRVGVCHNNGYLFFNSLCIV